MDLSIELRCSCDLSDVSSRKGGVDLSQESIVIYILIQVSSRKGGVDLSFADTALCTRPWSLLPQGRSGFKRKRTGVTE